MCRLIEKNGWVLRRISRSHHIYSKPGHQKRIPSPSTSSDARNKSHPKPPTFAASKSPPSNTAAAMSRRAIRSHRQAQTPGNQKPFGRCNKLVTAPSSPKSPATSTTSSPRPSTLSRTSCYTGIKPGPPRPREERIDQTLMFDASSTPAPATRRPTSLPAPLPPRASFLRHPAMSLNPNPLPPPNDARPHFARTRCNAIFRLLQSNRETEHIVPAALA